MMRAQWSYLVVASILGASPFACSSASDGSGGAGGAGSGEQGGSAGGADEGGAGPTLSNGGTDTSAATCDGNGPGCGCSTPGSTSACWTGSASLRNVGKCHDGTATCGAGETPTFGVCEGEELECGVDASTGGTTGTGEAGSTAPVQTGAGDSGGGPVCSAMQQAQGCVLGTVRWCDDGSCFWGKQTCVTAGDTFGGFSGIDAGDFGFPGIDGGFGAFDDDDAGAGSANMWSDCLDTENNEGPTGCSASGIYYDENCCEQSDECCAHAVAGVNYSSVGSCAAIDPCDSCQELCAQGAVRWCAAAGGGEQLDGPSDGGWGKQSCKADGTWDTCTATQDVPSGCSASAGASLTGSYDESCCAASGACCEVFDSESADPGSVNCPASACSAQWAAAQVPVESDQLVPPKVTHPGRITGIPGAKKAPPSR